MRLPRRDSATGKGIATGIQAVFGFLFGLVVVVWQVPGVPEAVLEYTKTHVVEILIVIGLPSGFVGFISNVIRKGVEKY